MLIGNKPEHQHCVLIEEKFDNIRAWVQHSPLKQLAQETGVSKGTINQ
jgi:hypothetical protein